MEGRTSGGRVTMSILIRNATLCDAPEICSLEQTFFSPDCNEGEIERRIREGGSCFMVCQQEGEITAYLYAKAVLDEADLWYIAVKEQYRNQGIGTRLLEAFLEEMSIKKIKCITLEVRKSNKSAIALYEKHKFQCISIRKDYYKNPMEDAVIYQYIETEETV